MSDAVRWLENLQLSPENPLYDQCTSYYYTYDVFRPHRPYIDVAYDMTGDKDSLNPSAGP